MQRLQVVFALGVCSICAFSQGPENALPRKAPELKLKIIPGKTIYALHEKAFTKAEFTNVSSKILCFPEPVQDCMDSVPGYLITKGAPVNSREEVEQFICVIDRAVPWPREKLVTEIEQHWIKLAPNGVYVTKSADVQVNLSVPGQWQFEATYHPPEGAFHPAESRSYLQSAAQIVGCTIPDAEVSAEPIRINVSSTSDQK